MKTIRLGDGKVYVFAITSAGVLTVVHSATPDDLTFDSFLNFCDAHRRDLRCYFILAGAGAPTPAQRARSGRRHPHLTPVKTAIVTMDAATLSPVAGLLQRDRPTQVIKVFSTEALPDAIRFLGLDASAAREACETLTAHAKQVKLSLPLNLLRELDRFSRA